MKLQIMSDLHLEYHDDGGAQLIKELDSSDIDILVLAGDIGEIKCINFAIDLFCEKYKKIIYIPGNHEYYGSDAGNVIHNFDLIQEKHSNLYILDNKIVELEGRRFIGCTLWYSFVSPEKTWDWSDFKYIRNFGDWVWDENKKAKQFLDDNLKEGDIVISHYLPSPKCINPKYKTDSTNVFYLSNMEALIEDRKPLLWIHGHTHAHVDTKVGDTRIVANPRGYTMFHETIEENGFDDKFIIEV